MIWYLNWINTCITRRHRDDVSWRQRMGRTVWLALCNVHICGAKSINECWTRQLTADDSENKKQRSQPTIEANRVTEEQERVESKVESTYWRFLTSQVFSLTLHVSVLLLLFFGFPCPLNKQCLTPVLCTPSVQHGVCSGARHHTHA